MNYNLKAERAVLGACLISSEELGRISEFLRAEDFYDANNRKAYEICLDLYSAGKAVDLVTFQAEAQNRSMYERLGGQPYLLELMRDTTALENAKYHAELVKGAALRRRIEDAGKSITALARKPDVEDLAGKAEELLLEAAEVKRNSKSVSVNSIMPSVLEGLNEIWSGRKKNRGFFTRFMDLDQILGGFQPGTLNIIAARPSMGKTALALNIAQFGGCEGRRGDVLLFSLEMSSEQLTHRMLSAQSGITLTEITDGGDIAKFKILETAAREIEKLKIHINDCSSLTAMDFRTECRRFKMHHPELSLVIVDYLQLMEGDKRAANRQYEMAEISRVMKLTAAELDCPIIALSQLSRETEKRPEKKPQLSDLRDSGAIEQDADTVLLLYREDYYSENENNSKLDSEASLRVAKNRNGRTGTCNLIFKREYTRVMSYGNL